MPIQATIQSRCECQAMLWASLNQQRYVLSGWATEPRRRRQESCPAHSINADKDIFEVAWLCPYCGRNTLRLFYAAALTFKSSLVSERPPASRTPPAIR